MIDMIDAAIACSGNLLINPSFRYINPKIIQYRRLHKRSKDKGEKVVSNNSLLILIQSSTRPTTNKFQEILPSLLVDKENTS